ncbi:efflux RND transporter periplasmic adaptor subunit [Flavobacteriaceae bacterium Ap0902]|nr:efflux RND transporter periplasmic adaptor subunit [Flavobacteriaceae bacterium Ap0902]
MRNILYLFLMSLFFIGCNQEEQAPPRQLQPYPVIAVEQTDVTAYQEYPAKLQGINNNEVRAKIPGYITQVLVDEGEKVNKGQILFRLETNTLNESATAARAGISASKANIEAAKARVNAAKVEVDRLKPLVERNIISSVQLETANANLMSAQSQLAQAEAARSQASAAFNEVQANIGYSVIRSPISGVVGKINQREGSLVGPTSQLPITTVSQTNEIYAYFSMNESQYFDFLDNTEGSTNEEKLANIPEVELILANGQKYPQPGKIEAVTGQIDPNAGTVQFRASFDNSNRILSNGNSGTIRIPESYPNTLVIPEQSTFEQQGIVYVYGVENDTVRNRKIEVILRIDNMALVSSGLEKGDSIVAAGVGTLRNGTAITPQPTKLDSIISRTN